jgi:hypothetical protein
VHRRVLLTVSAVAVTSAVLPGYAAAPPVDAGRVAATTLTIALGHGRSLSLDLRAAALTAGNTLRIVSERCTPDGGCSATMYQGQLDPAALHIDPSGAVADLQVTLAGHRLRLRWQPDSSTAVVVGGGEAEGDFGGGSGSEYAGNPATVTVELDGRQVCTGGGAVGTGMFADTSSTTGRPEAAALTRLRLPAKATVRCAPPA